MWSSLSLLLENNERKKHSIVLWNSIGKFQRRNVFAVVMTFDMGFGLITKRLPFVRSTSARDEKFRAFLCPFGFSIKTVVQIECCARVTSKST